MEIHTVAIGNPKRHTRKA